MLEKQNYTKHPLSVEEQVALLASRGLIINDYTRAEAFFTFVNYYRFSAYSLNFETRSLDGSRTHCFQKDVNLVSIIELYEFDHKLRLHFVKALESIEIAFRSVFCNHMALKYGSHWYENCNLFFNVKQHADFLRILKFELLRKKETELFLKHYSDKYGTPERPPAWMIIEILSLGTTSKLFDNLKFKKDQKIISRYFDLPPSVCASWMHSITTLRNVCAHHSRLWNRYFPFTMAIPHALKKEWTNTDKLYDYMWILKELLQVIHQDSEWLSKLKNLLQTVPLVDKSKMGFEFAWELDSIWQGLLSKTH